MLETSLWLLFLAGVGGWWYLSSTRENALAAAKQHCQQMGVQFLDGSVMTNGYRLARNNTGNLVLVQRFRFEFSTTGDQRYAGSAELVGKRVIKLTLEAHRV